MFKTDILQKKGKLLITSYADRCYSTEST